MEIQWLIGTQDHSYQKSIQNLITILPLSDKAKYEKYALTKIRDWRKKNTTWLKELLNDKNPHILVNPNETRSN